MGFVSKIEPIVKCHQLVTSSMTSRDYDVILVTLQRSEIVAFGN